MDNDKLRKSVARATALKAAVRVSIATRCDYDRKRGLSISTRDTLLLAREYTDFLLEDD